MRISIRAVLAPFAAVAASVLVASCGGPTDTSGSGGAGGTTTAALTFGTGECGICVETKSCVAQLQACAADPSCAAYLECLDACPLGADGDADVACEQACPEVTGSAGQTAHQDFLKCRTSGDGAACVACGKIDAPKSPVFQQTCPPDPPPEDVGNKCYVCEDIHCCDTYAACHDDPECKALGDCVKACADIPCEDACYEAHPTGFSKWGDRVGCVLHFCADDDACGDVPLDPCVACDNLHCADEDLACREDIECTLLRDCQTPCDPTDDACRAACEQDHPDGVAPFTAWADCAVENCILVCGGSAP